MIEPLDTPVPEQFYDVKPGEWLTPVKTGYLMACCDCGLVHWLDFRVIRDNKKKKFGKRWATIQGAAYRVQFRAYCVQEKAD